MKRFLTHHLIIDGKEETGLRLITVTDNRQIKIAPFDGETAATIYVDDSLTITTVNGLVDHIQANGKILTANDI